MAYSGSVSFVNNQAIDAIIISPIVAHLKSTILVVLIPRDIDARTVNDVRLIFGPIVCRSSQILFLGARGVVWFVAAQAVEWNEVLVAVDLIAVEKHFRQVQVVNVPGITND